MIENYPNDKSTIFSIVPFEINEFKPGIYPGSFRVPACMDDSKPQRLVVGPSEHLMTVGGRREPVRIITPSYQIAASVVRDFLDGQLFATPESCPGVAWAQGFVEAPAADMLSGMKKRQHHWFVNICKQTDDDWKKYGTYRVVSDQARFAARVLGLEPEWMKTEEVGFHYAKCKACGTMNDPHNAICSNCRCVLDEEKYKKLTFAVSAK